MEDGSEAEAVFADAETVFELGRADAGLPQLFGLLAFHVGAQQAAAAGEFGPFAVGGVLSHGDGRAFAASVFGTVLLDYPASWLKSVTFDNGTEFALHERLGQTLPVQVDFADSYAAYQRGANENATGLIRAIYPRGKGLRNSRNRNSMRL